MGCRIYKKGITFVELIIVTAILAIVLAGAYAIFGTGNVTYSRGTKQYDIQSSIRNASDYLTQQLRYAADVEIKAEGSVPDAASIKPYENYIYYDNSSKAIVHYNKYFTKTLLIGHPGSINFKKADSDKKIDFDIRANNSSQKYNIDTKINIMNVHLSAGGVISGIEEGPVLSFKTSNDYMSEKLRPIAVIDQPNSETEIGIVYDREVIDVEIISQSDVTVTKTMFSTNELNMTFFDTKNGATVIFRVTFGGLVTYGNIYDYEAVYNGDTKTWNIL